MYVNFVSHVSSFPIKIFTLILVKSRLDWKKLLAAELSEFEAFYQPEHCACMIFEYDQFEMMVNVLIRFVA